MLLDAQNLFSDNQSITTGTILSTNTVKFGKSDISYLPLLIQVSEDFSDLTSLTIKVQTSQSAEFTSAQDLAQVVMPKASLTQGSRIPITHVPEGNLGYMRLAYTVSGSDETTGKITAGIVAGLDRTISEI